MSEIRIRRAGDADARAVAELLYATAEDMYNRFAGGRERALDVVQRAFAVEGNNASAEVIWVAEVEDEVAGALAAFPVEEGLARGRAMLALTARSIPPWRWPGCLRVYWAGARATPSPPASALYIDSLATSPDFRRRGVARALLEQAELLAGEGDLPSVALDTSLDNRPARALYLSAGYDEVAYQPPGRRLPGFVALVKPLR